MNLLEGARVLLVEDEYLIAMSVAEMLSSMGATVVGPASTVDQGVDLARREPIDAAVLDLNMNGLRSVPVADALNARRIPFVLATGYGDEAKKVIQGAPVLDKPYTSSRLAEVLQRLLNRPH